MIYKLTPKQEAQLEVYAEKWRNIGLSTKPANRSKAEEGAKLAYQLAGYQPPTDMLWFESPYALCEYGMEMTVEHLCVPIVYDVIQQVKDSIDQKVDSKTYARLLSTITLVALRHQGMPRFFVEREIRDTFPLALSKVTRQQHDILSLCPMDYMRHELDLRTETDNISGCLKVAINAGWWSPMPHECLFSERPGRINFDADHQFHCEDGLAIGYPDGWGVYAWHGVRVPEHVIMRPQDITPDKIMEMSNREVARVMLERYGKDNFIRDGGFSKVQSDDYGDLYCIEFKNGDEPIVAVQVQDASTDRDYFLYVPPDIRTAHEGITWTFDNDNLTDDKPDHET